MSLQYGKRVLFDEVNVNFYPGNCYGIIVNGAGKSFMKILSGDIDPTKGKVSILPVCMSVLKQNHFEYNEFSVLDTVIGPGNKRLYPDPGKKTRFTPKLILVMPMALRPANWRRSLPKWTAGTPRAKPPKCLPTWACSPTSTIALVKDLSGKEKVKTLLAQALFGNPDILLLDEPTNDWMWKPFHGSKTFWPISQTRLLW